MHSCKSLILGLPLLLLSFYTSSAAAAYCGNRVVTPSTESNPVTTTDVAALCGQPTNKENRTEYVTTSTNTEVADNGLFTTREREKRQVQIHYSRWTYNRGPNQFMQYMTFRNGLLISITDGGYGH